MKTILLGVLCAVSPFVPKSMRPQNFVVDNEASFYQDVILSNDFGTIWWWMLGDESTILYTPDTETVSLDQITFLIDDDWEIYVNGEWIDWQGYVNDVWQEGILAVTKNPKYTSVEIEFWQYNEKDELFLLFEIPVTDVKVLGEYGLLDVTTGPMLPPVNQKNCACEPVHGSCMPKHCDLGGVSCSVPGTGNSCKWVYGMIVPAP